MVKSRWMSGRALALACAAATAGMVPGAEAADYLRGAYSGDTAPASAGVDWAGIYGGVHAGITSVQADHRSMARPLADSALASGGNHWRLLQETIKLKDTNKPSATYGGFVGVNWLWDDVVLGVEADYTRMSFKSTTNFGPYALYSDSGTERYGITSTSTSRAKVSDVMTLRGRLGWAAGMFMPYLTAGLAFANVDARATTSGTWYTQSLLTPPAYPTINGTFNGVAGRRGITYGAALGAGVDMQLLPGTFTRVEWQYVQLASGGQRPNISINTARVAGGIKF